MSISKATAFGFMALSIAMVAQATAPDLPLQQIIDRNIAARGGATAWRAIKTMSVSGTMDVGMALPSPAAMAEDPRHPAAPRRRLHPEPDKAAAEVQSIKPITAPFQMDFKRPHMTRVELKVRDQTSVQVYDGRSGWKLRPYLGRHQLQAFTPVELKIAAGQQELDGPLVDYAGKGTRVEKSGIEQVAGKDAYKLKLTLKDGQVRTLWIDAQTFLDVQIASSNPKPSGKGQMQVATLMSDYRAVNGVQVPFHLENHVGGVTMPQRILIEQVAVNPALADDLFGKPR
jgi:hypothetical protein